VLFESLPSGEEEPVGQRDTPPERDASPGVSCDVNKGVEGYDYQDYCQGMGKGMEQASAVVLVLEAMTHTKTAAGTDRMGKPAAYGGSRFWDTLAGEVMDEPPVDEKDYNELE